MSIAYAAAALSVLANVALEAPAVSAPGQEAFAASRFETHAAHRDRYSIVYYGHALEVEAESHPARFQAGLQPILKIPAAEYSTAKPSSASPALTATVKPKSGVRSYGAITDISENVHAIVEYYDEMEWRPIEMDGGGGVQYRMRFGAPETEGK